MYGVRNFALLDDIAAIMDDVVVMSKKPLKKRNIRDDLAVNAEKHRICS
jgi:predicted DNA repair protein MutK